MLEPVQRIPRYRLLLAGVCVCGGVGEGGREEGVWYRSESLHVGTRAENTKISAVACWCVCVGGRRGRGREEGVWCRSESLHVGTRAENTKISAVACWCVCVCVWGEEGEGEGGGGVV